MTRHPDRAFIEELARAAGSVLMSCFARLKKGEIREKSTNDYVTRADRLSQTLVIRRIRNRFPGHQIMAEESLQAARLDPGKPLWIIDPLDGTTNFIHQYPVFTVSIAFYDAGRARIGAVYDPNRLEMFSAERGRGAFLNRRRIRVSSTPDTRRGLLATGFPFKPTGILEHYIRTFRAISGRSRGIRRAGSASLDLCYVACGRFDGYWEFGLQPWDFAAGWLLVEEAGGKVSDFEGNPFRPVQSNVVAGNPRVYRQVKKFIKDSVQRTAFTM